MTRKSRGKQIADEGYCRSRAPSAQPGEKLIAESLMAQGIVLSALLRAGGCTYRSGERRRLREKEGKEGAREDEDLVNEAAVAKVADEAEVHSEMPKLVHALGIPWLGRQEIWMTKRREHEWDSLVALLMCGEGWQVQREGGILAESSEGEMERGKKSLQAF